MGDEFTRREAEIVGHYKKVVKVYGAIAIEVEKRIKGGVVFHQAEIVGEKEEVVKTDHAVIGDVAGHGRGAGEEHG